MKGILSSRLMGGWIETVRIKESSQTFKTAGGNDQVLLIL